MAYKRFDVKERDRLEIEERAQKYSKMALDELAEIIRDHRVSAGARVTAISVMLDRAIGKPATAPAPVTNVLDLEANDQNGAREELIRRITGMSANLIEDADIIGAEPEEVN